MNLDHLRTFVVAADCLNFTHTARQLHLSQPAVSQQIRDLEERLEVALFERRGRGLALTPAGERLQPLAQGILRELRRLESALGPYRGQPQGVLRIGAQPIIGTYLLPHALGYFSRIFPGVRLSLEVADLESLLKGIHQDEFDVVLSEHDVPAGRLVGWKKQAFLHDEMLLVTPPKHPWTQRDRISPTELTGAPFILRPRGYGVREQLADNLAKVGLSPEQLSVRFELTDTEGIKHAVMAGLGVAFISRLALAFELGAGLLKPVQVEGFSWAREYYVLSTAGKQPPPFLERFLELLSSQAWQPPQEGPAPSGS